MAAKPPYAKDAQIEHSLFGLGMIVSCNEDRTVIKFDDHGEKKFVTSIVVSSLKKSDRQAPPDRKGTRRRTAKAKVAETAATA